MKITTVTEFARNLSALLDQVELKGEELILVRNNRQIAKIQPGPGQQTAMEAMSDLYRTLPTDAGATWAKDARSKRGLLTELRDPWAS
jgi:antitoxin (DNA-binding transcriptional repressor) of toxin-antitoxin stability system